MNSTQKTTEPRIYVADLAAYNAGILRGEWIDLTETDDIREDIAGILRNSPESNVTVECPECEGGGCDDCHGKGAVPSAEEWAIHDYEGMPSGMGENPDIDDLEKIREAFETLADDWDAYIAACDDYGEIMDEDRFREVYMGEWDSEEDYAIDLWDQCGYSAEIPENLRFYIDYAAFARDLFMGDYSSESTGRGTIYVFDRNA